MSENYTDLLAVTTSTSELILCPSRNTTGSGVVSVATGLVVLILALFTICLNSLLLFIIFSKAVIRPLNALIANLSLVSILAAGLGAVYICGLDTLFQKLWICSTFSFLRNMVNALISLSVLSISYERVRRVDADTTLTPGRLLVSRTIFCIWTLALVINIPSLFATVLVSHTHPGGEVHSVCMKAPPSQYFGLGVIYEVVRSLVFHIAVPAYMIFELYRIRETVTNFLHVTAPTSSQIQRRVRRVRFIYINSIIFICIWFPFGVGISIYKNTTLTASYEKFIRHPELDCEDGIKLGKKSPGFYILVFLFYSYIVLLPLLIFFSNETFSNHLQPIRLGRKCWKSKNSNLQNSAGVQEQGQQVDGVEIEEGTRWKGDTTFAISENCSEIQLSPEVEAKLEDKLEEGENSVGVVQPTATTSFQSLSNELLI